MQNKIIAINEAEGIFYPAFDKYLCNDGQMSAEGTVKERLWDSLTFRGGKTMTVCWRGEVELKDYDRFIGFISIPEETGIKASAAIDGEIQELESEIRGAESPVELTASMTKKGGYPGILTEIRLEFCFQPEKNVIVVSWLGLSKSCKETEIEKAVPRWNPEWDKEVNDGIWGRIDDNLVLSEQAGEELKALLAKADSMRRILEDNALKAMKIQVEEQLREYAPQEPHKYRFTRVRDRGRIPLENHILNLAVAGCILEEPSYSRQAARLILGLLPMKWFEGPVCGMEGSQFHHVCFTEDHLLSEVCLAMGFLGGVIKQSAMDRITEKISQVWQFVRSKCMEPGYRNFMNQGVVGNRGAMIGAAFLEKHRGGYDSCLDEAYERHCKILGNYLTGDGHCAEGGNYYEYSFSTSILLWHIYSRMRELPVEQVVPDSFKRSGRYLAAMMCAGDRYGTRQSVNCGKRVPVSTLLLVFMTMVCDFPEGNNYLIARFSGSNEDIPPASFDLLFYLYYKKQITLQPCHLQEKEEISFPAHGLLTYRMGSCKLIVTAERNPLTAHFHEDRGGIVLEDQGEILLPDLGTTDYSDPVCLVMDKKEYHNLAYPADLKMTVESPLGISAAAEAAYPIEKGLSAADMKIPEAKVLYHHVDHDCRHFAVDTGMLFGEGITGIREGSFRTGNLTLKDSWSLPAAHSLVITYLSYQPWEIRHQTARSGRLEIQVKARETWSFRTEEGMKDFSNKEVFVLRIETESGTDHEVESLITWSELEPSPEKTGRENTLAFQSLLNRGGTIRIEKPGIYEIEDTLIVKSHTRLSFGPGVLLKRSATSIGSFAMINEGAFTRSYDTDITIEGLHLITNKVEARHHASVYGLTGELSFFYVKRLRITDFECLDLPRLSFGIHVCTFEDLMIERVHIEGRKDAIHLGTGNKFLIRHGLFRTFDDPIALNAHDYAVANPQMGWIENGLIEDCYDMDDEDTTGYFCRILAGAWCDWYEGMEIQNSDTVISGGRVYRAFQNPDGTKYRSVTPPLHEEGLKTLDGINWVMVQEEITYQCGCRNIHFKDIHLQKKRQTALSIHFDHDRYSRSVYPGAKMPEQQNLVFENIVVENQVDCLVRTVTPVDTIKILSSVIGENRIQLEALPEMKEEYPDTHVLLMGNTFTAEGEMGLVLCKKGRSCLLTEAASLVISQNMKPCTFGNVTVIKSDMKIIQEEDKNEL